MKKKNRFPASCCPACPDRPLHRLASLFFCVILVAVFGIESKTMAAEVEIFTPRPGATVIARNPETHLVLRQADQNKVIHVKVEKTGKLLDPEVTMEGEEYIYQHFRLPLQSGMNRFTLLPDGKQFELNFQPLRASLNQKTLGKEVYLFHQSDKLPEGCRECHDLQETETVDRMGLKKETSCGTCHKSLLDTYSWKHSPVVNQQCLSCHQQSVKPWRIGFPLGKIDDICLTCHISKKDWQSRKYPHGPMIGGCTLCHSPHGSNFRYMLWADGSTDICIACHFDKQNLVSKKKEVRLRYVHGIISGMGCVACHDPHGTNNQFSLLKPINELCVSCHTRLAGVSRGHPVERHPVSGRPDPRRPGRTLVCTSCHDPHGTSNKFMLVETYVGGRLCRVCHKK